LKNLRLLAAHTEGSLTLRQCQVRSAIKQAVNFVAQGMKAFRLDWAGGLEQLRDTADSTGDGHQHIHRRAPPIRDLIVHWQVMIGTADNDALPEPLEMVGPQVNGSPFRAAATPLMKTLVEPSANRTGPGYFSQAPMLFFQLGQPWGCC